MKTDVEKIIEAIKEVGGSGFSELVKLEYLEGIVTLIGLIAWAVLSVVFIPIIIWFNKKRWWAEDVSWSIWIMVTVLCGIIAIICFACEGLGLFLPEACAVKSLLP